MPPVRLSAPDGSWPERGLREEAVLRAAFGDALVGVQHVGSTAVPGLEAKPIIDVLVVARSLDAADACRARVEDAGFLWRGEYGLAGRRYLVRRGESEDATHVHVFAIGDRQVWRHLAFRDQLVAHEGLAREYASLKRRLALVHHDDRAAYTDGKGPFVEAVLARAAREVFHITAAAPPVAPGPEGFVHLSNARQVVRTANRFFRGQRGLSLLELDATGLDVRWEWNDGDLFPHLYGTLRAESVVRAWPFAPGVDGAFAFPG